MAEDDGEERLARRKRQPQVRPPRLAAGSDSFGRTLPSGVADEVARLQRDDKAEPATFGAYELHVEHHDGAVVLVFPDGTRAVGSPEEARDLAKLLLGPVPWRR
jgi:hypothetical protein